MSKRGVGNGWMPHHDEILTRLWDKTNGRQIADRLGFSIDTVNKHVRKLGLPRTARSMATQAQAIAQRRDPVSGDFEAHYLKIAATHDWPMMEYRRKAAA